MLTLIKRNALQFGVILISLALTIGCTSAPETAEVLSALDNASTLPVSQEVNVSTAWSTFDFEKPKIRPITLPQMNASPRGLIQDQFAPVIYDKFSLIVRHLGFNCRTQKAPPGTSCEEIHANKKPVTWNVGQLTGFEPPQPMSDWQVGAHDLALPVGSSAFQMHGYDIGSFINTWTFNHTQSVVGGGPHSVYSIQYRNPETPWRTSTSALTLQANIEIPWVLTWKEGVGQLSFFFYLRDKKSGVVFPYIVAIHDSRPLLGDEHLSHDTFHPFVSVPLKEGTRYAIKSPYSETMQTGSGWRGLRFFRVHVTGENLIAAVTDLQATGVTGLSLNPSNYVLIAAGILHEVFAGVDPESNVSMAVHIKDMGIYEFH